MDSISIAVGVLRHQIVTAIILIIEKLRNKRHKRLWSRQWLERRDICNNLLTMLFEELGPKDPKSFQNYTRMQEEVMEELLFRITPYIEKKDTVMRKAISPRMRLSATLRYLATGNSFQDLSFSTRIAPNTLSQVVMETVRAIISVLEEEVISFPCKPEDWKIIADRFQTLWQFPYCIGALDGKHIFFRPPRCNGSMYRNYKGRDSIIILALVDADYKFIFVDIGKNGRTHDSLVFRESPLGIKMRENNLNLPQPSNLPEFNYKMPYVMVDDDAFPLHENLMKPYPERGLTQHKRIFNYRLSRARRVSENAFGILVNRFRILLNPMALSVEKVETITYACVLLHNFLLQKKVRSYIPIKYRSNNSEIFESRLCSVRQQGGNRSSISAGEVRDMFATYFNTIGIVPWQYDIEKRGNY